MKAIKVIAVTLLFIVGIGSGVTAINGFNKRSEVHAATVKTDATNAALDSIVTSVGSQYGTKVGIVVYDTTTGHTASTNADGQYVSASLYKLYVAYGVLRGADNGSISLGDNLDTVDESVSTCLNKMITVSDNDCGKALGDLVGWGTLDTLLQSQGYKGTMLNNYYADGTLDGDKQTTAADVALLLERLDNGTLLSASSNSLFLNLLASQEINSYLPSGFDASIKIAHKTGTLYGYVHDAGIVSSANKKLIVVFMSGQWTDPDTDSIPVFQAFGKSLESYLDTY